jgi:hypothetical protein
MILMADSIEPGEIPGAFKADRNRGVLLYADGLYQPSFGVAHQFPRRQWISVTGNPAAAATARWLDVERYDATAADWPAFRLERERILEAGGAADAIGSRGWPGVYCSIDPGPPYGITQVLAACHNAGQEPPQRILVAWYTYGAKIPARDEVLDQIHALTGEILEEHTIWGCQYDTGSHYDLSVVYAEDPEWS